MSETATYDDGSSVVDDLLSKLKDYYESSKFYNPVIWPKIDQNYDPAKYGGVWGPWGSGDADVNCDWVRGRNPSRRKCYLKQN